MKTEARTEHERFMRYNEASMRMLERSIMSRKYGKTERAWRQFSAALRLSQWSTLRPISAG